MKKWITNNWKKILICIGVVAMIVIFIEKLIAPKTIISDYIKYGKVVTPTEGTSELVDSAKENIHSVWNSVDPQFAKLVVIMMVAILIVVFISSVASKAGEKKDTKKK